MSIYVAFDETGSPFSKKQKHHWKKFALKLFCNKQAVTSKAKHSNVPLAGVLTSVKQYNLKVKSVCNQFYKQMIFLIISKISQGGKEKEFPFELQSGT